jgi:hypothetical protein
VYAGLFSDDLDAVAQALDGLVPYMRPSGTFGGSDGESLDLALPS